MKAIGSLSPGLRAEIERIAARRGEPPEIIAGVVVAVRNGARLPTLESFRELAQHVAELGERVREPGTMAAREYREAVVNLNRTEAALLAAGITPREIDAALEDIPDPVEIRTTKNARRQL